MPLVNPEQVAVVPETVQVAPAGFDVTVYELGVPPEPGGAQLTVAWPLPAVTVGVPGAPGGASGVTGADGVEALDVPPTFVAVTENV